MTKAIIIIAVIKNMKRALRQIKTNFCENEGLLIRRNVVQLKKMKY